MSERFQKISIDDLDLTDQRYRISFEKPDIDALAGSIESAGLICPPVVRPAGQGYVIVSGFNRIEAIVLNRENTFFARVLPQDTPESRCHVMAITALAFQRPLTHAELIIAVRRLSRFYPMDTLAQKSRTIFNTRLNAGFLQMLLSISHLPDIALDLIHNGLLSIKAAQRILGLKTHEIQPVLTLFSQMKASASKQLEIITCLTEISRRDNIALADILNQQQIQVVLADQDFPPGVKTNLVRTILYQIRFPSIATAQQEMKKQIAALKLGPGISVVVPENFESPGKSVSFEFKSPEEFEARLQALKTAAQTPAFSALFHL